MPGGRPPLNKNYIKKKEEGYELEIQMVNIRKGIYRVLFDKDILSEVNKYTWCINNGGYAIVTLTSGGKRTLFLHHLVLPKKEGVVIDHINQNKLDNRRENLRYANKRLNATNSGMRIDNTTGIKGISYKPKKKLWHAYLNINGERIQKHFKDKQKAIDFRKELEEKYICL